MSKIRISEYSKNTLTWKSPHRKFTAFEAINNLALEKLASYFFVARNPLCFFCHPFLWSWFTVCDTIKDAYTIIALNQVKSRITCSLISIKANQNLFLLLLLYKNGSPTKFGLQHMHRKKCLQFPLVGFRLILASLSFCFLSPFVALNWI